MFVQSHRREKLKYYKLFIKDGWLLSCYAVQSGRGLPTF
jgi:hypothetical protein